MCVHVFNHTVHPLNSAQARLIVSHVNLGDPYDTRDLACQLQGETTDFPADAVQNPKAETIAHLVHH
jgi:hypothetical protein